MQGPTSKMPGGKEDETERKEKSDNSPSVQEKQSEDDSRMQTETN